jgi:hypothetical protein
MKIIVIKDFANVADTKDIQLSHMNEVQVDGENINMVNVEANIICKLFYYMILLNVHG